LGIGHEARVGGVVQLLRRKRTRAVERRFDELDAQLVATGDAATLELAAGVLDQARAFAPGVRDDSFALAAGVGFGACADGQHVAVGGFHLGASFGDILAQVIAAVLGVHEVGVARDLALADGR
jgi:hypothetical protein